MSADDQDFMEALCNLQIPYEIKFSPDGQNIAYTTQLTWSHKRGKHLVSTIWCTNEPGSARQLTDGNSRDTSLTWHPSGGRIAFISDRAQPGSTNGIYTLELSSGKTQLITPANNKQTIESFAYSPDGKYIAYLAADEKTSKQLQDEKDGIDIQIWGETWTLTRLKILEIASGEVKTLAFEGHVTAISWSSDGSQLCFLSCRGPPLEFRFNEGSSLFTVDVGLTKVETLCRFPAYVRDLRWAVDGKIYILTGLPLKDTSRGHAVYNIDPGRQNAGLDYVGFGVHNDAEQLLLCNDEIFVLCHSRLDVQVSRLGGPVVYSISKEVECIDLHADGDGTVRLAAAFSDVSHPVEVYTGVCGSSNMVKLSNHASTLGGTQFDHGCHVLTCSSDDGEFELDALYLTPSGCHMNARADRPERPLPTIVMPHGGPNTRSINQWNACYWMLSPLLLRQGYGILLPNYRGSSGRGSEFTLPLEDGAGVHDYNDVITQTDHAVKAGFADADRLVIVGGSHGGFLAYLSCVRNGLHGHGWLFKAAVAVSGISDFDSMALMSDVGDTYLPQHNGGRVPWNVHRTNVENRKASALANFHEAVVRSKETQTMTIPPVLIIHGEVDVRVPLAQAVGFRRALESQGLPFQYVTYPRGAHFFDEQVYWIDMLKRISTWCDRYIGKAIKE